MWRKLVSICALICSTELCFAETALLRSAEHGDFTRVVLDLNDPGNVSVSQTAMMLQIVLPKGITDVDSTNFFRRISRDVIAQVDVVREDRRIDLRLGCDCSFNKFIAGPKMLAIDLRKSVNDQSDFSTLATQLNWGMEHTGRTSPLTFGPPKVRAAPELKVREENVPGQSSGKSRIPLFLADSGAEMDNSAQQRMLSTLRNRSRQHTIFGSKLAGETDNQILFHSNQMVQSKALPEIEQNASRVLNQCDQLDHLNPLGWPNYDDARGFLSDARKQVSESDQGLNDSVMRMLATAYLSLGMGAEARSLLSAILKPFPADKDLILLSKIIDDEGNSEPLGGAHCPNLMIWHLLSSDQEQDNARDYAGLSAAQLKQIRSDFDLWPSALQGIFAAKLAEKLLALGSPDTAAYSLRRSKDLPEQKSGDHAMAAANLARKTQGAAAAVEILEPIVAGDSDKAPDAAIALTEIVLAEGKPLKSSQKSALETYREEYEGTELEQELLRARLRAAIQEADFALASELMQDYENMARPSQVDLLLDEFGEAIVHLENDATFLREAVSLKEKEFNRFAQTLQKQIKARVNDLGFRDLAAQLGSARNSGAHLSENSHDRVGIQENPAVPTGAKEKNRDRRKKDINDVTQAKATDPMTLDLTETPISNAVRETQSVLDDVNALKDELARLGF